MGTLILGKLRELEMQQKELTEEMQIASSKLRRALEDVPLDFLEAEVQRRLAAMKAKISRNASYSDLSVDRSDFNNGSKIGF